MQKNASHTVISISVFRAFTVEDRRKRVKKYVFSNENELVWTGENKTKMLVWWKTVCFVFVDTTTGTFENALVWSGPQIYHNLIFSLQMGFRSCPLGVSDSWYVEKKGNMLSQQILHTALSAAGNKEYDIVLGLVVRKVVNAIHRINRCPADSVVCFVNTYPLDSDLSGG